MNYQLTLKFHLSINPLSAKGQLSNTTKSAKFKKRMKSPLIYIYSHYYCTIEVACVGKVILSSVILKESSKKVDHL